MTRYLSLDDLLILVDELGVGPIRDIGLLESAAARPAVTVWGDDAYADLPVKAAALMESLARNHPLIDGNKRLAWLATVVFLTINGCRLSAPEDDAYDLVIAVSTGRMDVTTVGQRLSGWLTRPPS